VSLFSRAVVLFAITAAAHTASAAEPLRKWTNPQGRSIQARLISIEGDVARLQMANGDFVNVALEKFSEADRKYLDARKGALTAESATGEKRPADGESKSATAGATAAAADLRKTRKWTRQGKQFSARFVRFHDGKAILMQGNKPVDVPFGDLSQSDQAYLKEQFEALGRISEVPPAIPTSTRATGSVANNAPGTAPPPLFAQQASPPAAAQNFPPTNIAGVPSRVALPPRMELPRPFTPPNMNIAPPAARQTNTLPPNATVGNSANQTTHAPVAVASVPAFDPSASQSQQPIYQRQTSDTAQSISTASNSSQQSRNSPFFKWGQESSERANSSTPQIASAPPMTSPFSSGRNENEMVIQCGKCGKTQKPGFKAGGRCQHCGTVIDVIVDEGGKTVDRSVRSTGKMIKMWVGIGILVLGLLGGAIAKLRGS
jgi:hypothetical protein